MCRKIRQKVHGEWRYVIKEAYVISRSLIFFYYPLNRYFRSCAWMGEPGIEGDERFCLMRTGSYNIFMEYCTCNSKDGCNSSNRLITQGNLLLTLSVLIIIRNLRNLI